MTPTSKSYPKCSVPECDKCIRSSGCRYCETHYYRIRRNGTLELKRKHNETLCLDGYVKDSEAKSLGFYRQHRRVLFEKIGEGSHKCHHCGTWLSWEKNYPEHRDALTVDHLDEDKSNNDPDNLVPCCGACNLKRSQYKAIITFTRRFGIEMDGIVMLPKQWAGKIGISTVTLKTRIKKWGLRKALTEPRKSTGPKPHNLECHAIDHSGKERRAKAHS